MKLEVGKYYKSRCGLKWKCVHKHTNAENITMFLFVSDRNFHSLWCKHDGQFSTRETSDDIVSEWVEPVEHEVDVYFAINSVGEIVCNKTGYLFLKEIAKVKVKVKFTEGDGL